MELQWLANDLLTHNIESNRFAYFRTSKISFSSDDEVTWTLDGEFGGALHNVQVYQLQPCDHICHRQGAGMQRIIRKVLQNASLTVNKERMQSYYGIADGFRCARTTNAKTTAHFRKEGAVDFLLFIKSKLIQFHGRGGNLRIGRARDHRKRRDFHGHTVLCGTIITCHDSVSALRGFYTLGASRMG